MQRCCSKPEKEQLQKILLVVHLQPNRTEERWRKDSDVECEHQWHDGMKTLLRQRRLQMRTGCPEDHGAGDRERKTATAIHREVDLVAIVSDNGLADELKHRSFSGPPDYAIDQRGPPS